MSMIVNPVIALVHNNATDRWHPIFFKEAPLPGGHDGDPRRWKSGGHHTTGFASRGQAEADARDNLFPKMQGAAIGPVTLAVDHVFEWDGQDVPALVTFFDVPAPAPQ